MARRDQGTVPVLMMNPATRAEQMAARRKTPRRKTNTRRRPAAKVTNPRRRRRRSTRKKSTTRRRVRRRNPKLDVMATLLAAVGGAAIGGGAYALDGQDMAANTKVAIVGLGALAVGLFPKLEDPRAKMFTGILILTIIPPLLFTYSRSTYVSILPAALYLTLRSTRPQILIGIFLALLVASPFLLPKTVMERIKFTVSQAENIGQIQVGDIRLDTSLSARLGAVEKAAIGFIQHPVLGHGVTGFAFLDAQYLRVLIETGLIGDERCADAIDLLESKRLPDGGFPAEKKHYRVGRHEAGSSSLVDWGGTNKKRTNDFVTVDALQVLSASGRLL